MTRKRTIKKKSQVSSIKKWLVGDLCFAHVKHHPWWPCEVRTFNFIRFFSNSDFVFKFIQVTEIRSGVQEKYLVDFFHAKSSQRFGIVDANNMLQMESTLVQKSIQKNKTKTDYAEAVKYYFFLKNRHSIGTGGARAEESERERERQEPVTVAPALRRSSRLKEV